MSQHQSNKHNHLKALLDTHSIQLNKPNKKIELYLTKSNNDVVVWNEDQFDKKADEYYKDEAIELYLTKSNNDVVVQNEDQFDKKADKYYKYEANHCTKATLFISESKNQP